MDDTQALPPGVELVNGKPYMADAKGALVPVEAIKVTDRLMDEVVRKVAGYAEPLSAQIARFKQHCFDDVDAFAGLLAQEYDTTIGGRKGNITLTSFDGRTKVQVQVADNITFGPELQTAKTIVDECLNDWTSESHANIRAIINRAFNVDQQGKVNRAELFGLLRLEIDDKRWMRAMEAIRNSIRIVGSKRYVRVYTRDSAAGAWRPVQLDIASA